MMNRIYKYHLEGVETIVPKGDVLAVAFQKGRLYAWVRIRSDDKFMKLRVFATGEDCGWDDHVGTAVSDSFVFHVFRVI